MERDKRHGGKLAACVLDEKHETKAIKKKMVATQNWAPLLVKCG